MKILQNELPSCVHIEKTYYNFVDGVLECDNKKHIKVFKKFGYKVEGLQDEEKDEDDKKPEGNDEGDK